MKQIQKTASFAILHFLTAFTVAWVMTGSWLIGGAVALVEPAINTVVFFFHEKAWALKTSSPVVMNSAADAMSA
jgi:uncharacterized membrane protein